MAEALGFGINEITGAMNMTVNFIDNIFGVTAAGVNFAKQQASSALKEGDDKTYNYWANMVTYLTNRLEEVEGIKKSQMGGKSKRKTARKPRKAPRKTKQNKKRANKRKTQGKKK